MNPILLFKSDIFSKEMLIIFRAKGACPSWGWGPSGILMGWIVVIYLSCSGFDLKIKAKKVPDEQIMATL